MRLAPKLTPFYLNLGVLREFQYDKNTEDTEDAEVEELQDAEVLELRDAEVLELQDADVQKVYILYNKRVT